MYDQKLDKKKPLNEWQKLQHCKSIMLKVDFQTMTNCVGSTCSVGDAIGAITICLEQDI